MLSTFRTAAQLSKRPPAPIRQGGALLAIVGLLLAPSIGTAGNPNVRLLVKFSALAGDDAAAQALAAVGGTQVGTVHDLGVRVVKVPADQESTALAALSANPDVAFAEADTELAPQDTLPDDPYFPQQYALGGGAWGWYQTHTTQAWDITEGDPGVVVAILDTGLRSAGLSDFDGQIASTWNVLNNTTDVSSGAGVHGTYVAGAVGLAIGNGGGNAGYCPKCRLMIVQVGTDTGASLSDLASGLTWAADHGARVANMSWAGTSTSSTLQSAIAYAHSKGLVITAAAGNSNCDCKTYPAGYPGVIAVGGTDNVGNKQGDSNYGSWVTLAAPEGTMTAIPSVNGAPAGYAPVGGTSLAAPVVAGIAGLLFSYAPSLTNTQVEQALETTAAPTPFTVQYGRVDALAALQSLGASDPQPASAPVQTSAPQIYYELGTNTMAIAPLAGAPQVGQVLVRGVGGWTGGTGLAVTGLQWQRCSAAGTGCALVGSSTTYSVQAADVGSDIRLLVTVKNNLGSVQAAALSQPVGGAMTPTAPANVSVPTISGTAQVGSTLSATPGSWSWSPTSYAYQWQRCDAGGGSCNALGSGSTYAVQSADLGFTLKVAVTATNAGGSATASSAPTTVVTSAPPPPPPPPPAPTPAATQTSAFSGSLNQQNPSRKFTVTAGAGAAHATVTFSKCGSLSLASSDGGTATGASGLTLDSTVAAGPVTYTVSGGKCSFTLTVTTPKP